MKLHIGYICENCQQSQPVKNWVFRCIICGKEICESCMYGYTACNECAAGRTETELQARYDGVFAEVSQ